MGRTLPWAKSASTTKPTASAHASTKPRLTKRVKTEHSEKHTSIRRDSSPFDAQSIKQSSPDPPINGRRHSRFRDGRSPSTSPPPAPPPIDFMRPGLDEDDIYMLVEDEFHELAQSYTAHLHHAEYKRLMKLARERKAEQERAGLDLLGVGGKIPDNVSGETRQRLRGELLKERQSSGLKSMLGSGLPNGASDDDIDEEEAVLAEEKKVGDMWAGTALSGLMSWNQSQEKTSLKGLEKVSGETRASRGFGPSKKKPEQREMTGTTDVLERTSRPNNGHGIARSGESNSKNVPVVVKSVGHIQRPVPKSMYTAADRISAAPSRFNLERTTSLPKGEAKEIKIEERPSQLPKSRFRSLIDSLDDFDDAAFDATQTAGKVESPDEAESRQSRIKDREKRKKDRKARLDEVPGFLV